MKNCRLIYYFTEYIVEAQDMDEKGKFVVIGTVRGSETQMVARGLKDKRNYKFRFVSKNHITSKCHYPN